MPNLNPVNCLLALVLGVLATPVYAGTPIFVDAFATGSNDGSSWEHAFVDLAQALGAAPGGTEIWVAGGTYVASPSTFHIQGVELYGGFAGDESSRDARAWTEHPTVLSGAMLRTVASVTSSPEHRTVLDGFIVADGYSASFEVGGGLHVYVDSVAQEIVIANCVIRDNGGARGGGAHVQRGSPTFINCLFLWNRAGAGGGGAMYSRAIAGPTIVSSTFFGNLVSGGPGGAIAIENFGSPVISNSVFWNNGPGSIAGTSNGTVSYSCVEGGYAGIGVIDADPKIVDPVNDDFRLSPASPCIDAGSNDALPVGLSSDFAQRTRRLDSPRHPDTGQGVAPIVDMGAYEFSSDCNQNGAPDVDDLAAGTATDFNQNTVLDICEMTGARFCFGDASGGAACSCGNQAPGSEGSGCANAAGTGGLLEAYGRSVLGQDTLVFHASGLPPASPALYFQGDALDLVGGVFGLSFGNGLRCVYGSTLRLGARISSQGESAYGAGTEPGLLISQRGGVPAGGGVRYYQVWYRDNQAFCTGAGFNVTNAVEIQWVP